MLPADFTNFYQLWCWNNKAKTIFSFLDKNILEIKGGVANSATEIVIAGSSSSASSQKWQFNADNTIETLAKTNMVLDVYEAKKAVGTKVIIFKVHGNDN
jgi:hypothetical protein